MNGKIIPPELINRKCDENRQPISFEYDLIVEDEHGNPLSIPIRFTRMDELIWQVEMVYGYQVYRLDYNIPKRDLDLVMVAAFGLRSIQYQLQSEVQMKSIIDFTIGDCIKDM